MSKRTRPVWAIAAGVWLVMCASACSPAPEPEDETQEPIGVDEEVEEPAPPFTVAFDGPATYEPLSTKTMAVTMNYTGEEPVTALALRLLLPDGWQYAGIGGDLRPAIEPPAAARGELTFVWIQTPEFPATFACFLDTPEHSETVSLSAQAVYRGLGEEERSPMAVLELHTGG